MAKRVPKPTDKPQWLSTGQTKTEPGVPKQTNGWEKDEKPPYEYFNWFWNVGTRLFDYVLGRADKWNIIIDTSTTEGDYDTLEDYIADIPSPGDRVLVRQPQSLTGVMVIPDEITLGFMDGAEIISNGVAATILTIGALTKIVTPLLLRIDTDGAIPAGVSFSGDGSFVEQLTIIHEGNGALAAAIVVAAGTERVAAMCNVTNTGAGSITTVISDISTNTTNMLSVLHAVGVIRSNGFAHAHTSDGEGGDLGMVAPGTAMAFFQAAAPNGWTQDVTNNDKALRVVSGAGGGVGGTDLLSTPPNHTHVAPAHAHNSPIGNGGLFIATGAYGLGAPVWNSTNQISSVVNVTSVFPMLTSSSGASATGNQSIQFKPQYIDVIICTKD